MWSVFCYHVTELLCLEERLLSIDQVFATETWICRQHQTVKSSDWTLWPISSSAVSLFQCRRYYRNDVEGSSHFHWLSEFDENLDASLGFEDGRDSTRKQSMHVVAMYFRFETDKL